MFMTLLIVRANMKKWYLVSNGNKKADGIVKKAVEKYINIHVVSVGDVTEALECQNLILVGVHSEEAPINGYRIRSYEGNYNNRIISLSGYDYVNELYAAVDFENKYLVKAENADVHTPIYYFNKLFKDEMPDFDQSFTPHIKDRALWSWGYVIYDYKGYMDNMLRLKLNMLVIWNDYIPDNANEIVAYAHECGIKVIWGYAWGWDVKCGEIDLNLINQISDKAIEDYEKVYSNIMSDGIYFQTFTEISEDNINGIVVADAAVELVNMTSNKLLEKYPDMNIQFGLHATSVNTRLDTIKKTDPRVTILWEDCGAFPFAYIPKKTDNFDDTKKFVEQIKNLRDAGFGCLFKGMTALDWSTFVHQKGRFVLGEESAYALYDKLKEKEKIWKYIQAYWISNIDYVADIVKMLDPDTLVGALVEDGLFDIKMWYPVALYSELLWNPFRSTREILSETALIPSVAFAGDDTI